MANIEQTINNILKDFILEIQTDLEEKRIDNTKVASNSLEIVSNIPIISVKGIFYFYWLDKGRKPGKFPPVDKILEYVKTKPVKMVFNGKQLTDEQTAYLVGKGLKEKGSRIYRNNELGIELDKKIEQLTKNLNEKLPNFVRTEIINKLNKAFTS